MCQVEKPLSRAWPGNDKTGLASLLADRQATPVRCQACQLKGCHRSDQAGQKGPAADRRGMAGP